MDHEPEVRLVESHAEGRGGHQCLDAVLQQILFCRFAFGGIGLARVGGHGDAPLGQERREIGGAGDGQRVHDARARERLQPVGQPRETGRGVRDAHHREVEGVPAEAAAQHLGVGSAHAQLRGDVGDDPVVGRGGGGEHGHPVAQFGDQGADAAVVGPEVVTPVGDAVRLVHHDEPGVGGQ